MVYFKSFARVTRQALSGSCDGSDSFPNAFELNLEERHFFVEGGSQCSALEP